MDFPAVTICNMNSFRLSKVSTDDYYYVGDAIFALFDKEFNLRKYENICSQITGTVDRSLSLSFLFYLQRV